MNTSTELHRSRVLVTGATGYVGGRLVPELLSAGYDVRALARTPRKLEGRSFFGHPNLEILQGDVLDAASLVPALDGVATAYYLVHSLGAGEDFAERDKLAARTFAHACATAGVQRIVYLSGLGERDSPNLSDHLASRHETGDVLREGSVPVTELRAAVIVGSGSASYEIIHDLTRKLPFMIAPKWLRSRCEPIAIRDVVAYLVRVLDEPRTIGQVLDIGSGEVLTYQEMIRIFGEELGRPPLIIPVPLLTPRLSSWWLHLVTHVDFSVVQPLIEGLSNDVVCEEHRIREWIPMELTGYRDAVRLALKRSQSPERWSSWTDADRSVHPPHDHAPRAAVTSPRQRIHRDYRVFEADVPAHQLFDQLTTIGGEHGYGRGMDLFWGVRGTVDRMVGGPGLRRGRPKGDLHEGDPLDFWRVERLTPPHSMVLSAEMIVPGSARLEFRVEEIDDQHSRLHQVATLTGSSIWSTMYWGAVWPAHALVFNALGNHIVRGSHIR